MTKPIVQTTSGPIFGEVRDGICVFRGIPYGGRVDGDRRWLPATAPEAWSEPRDCTKNGPIAVQFGGSISGSGDFGVYFSGNKPEKFRCDSEVQSENCLVLNVLTPGCDDAGRPVLVYLHGGGYATGSGSLVLGADTWCREEDLVVVGINHRLNVFGSLHLGELDPKYAQSGMCSMLDACLALEWVRDNIAAFGGDPAKVTIMGESGGGGKVNHLIAMPRAKGLFRAAIVESGSSLPGRISKAQATESAKKLLETLGLKENELDKLLTIPAQEILQAADKVGIRAFSPSADEINMVYNPEGEYLECDPTLPLLVGASEEEMAAFAEPSDISWDQLRAKLLEDSSNGILGATNCTPETVDGIIADFRAIDKKGVSPDHVYFQIYSMSGALGSGAYLQAMAKAKKGVAPVYHYFVTFDAPHPRHPEQHYAWHTADLPLQMRIVAWPECEQISRAMARAWAAFIRTGSPDTQELPWPAFTAQQAETMVFDTVCRVENDPTKPHRDALAATR